MYNNHDSEDLNDTQNLNGRVELNTITSYRFTPTTDCMICYVKV